MQATQAVHNVWWRMLAPLAGFIIPLGEGTITAENYYRLASVVTYDWDVYALGCGEILHARRPRDKGEGREATRWNCISHRWWNYCSPTEKTHLRSGHAHSNTRLRPCIAIIHARRELVMKDELAWCGAYIAITYGVESEIEGCFRGKHSVFFFQFYWLFYYFLFPTICMEKWFYCLLIVPHSLWKNIYLNYFPSL